MTQIIVDPAELRNLSVLLRDAAENLTEVAYQMSSLTDCAGLPLEVEAQVADHVSSTRARLEQLSMEYASWAMELDVRSAVDQTGSTLAGVTAAAYGQTTITCCAGPVDTGPAAPLVPVSSATPLLPVPPAESATNLAVQGASAVNGGPVWTQYGWVSTAPLPVPPQPTAEQVAAMPPLRPLSVEQLKELHFAQSRSVNAPVTGVSIGEGLSRLGNAGSQFIGSGPAGSSPAHNTMTQTTQPLYSGNLTPGNAPYSPPPSVPSGQ